MLVDCVHDPALNLLLAIENDALRCKLLEVQQRVRELEAVIEAARTRAFELRCVQPELMREKEALTVDELRARVEGSENEETELADGLAEAKQRVGVNDDCESVALEKCSGLRQNLRDVEKARLDAHHERYELHRRLRSLDHERTRFAGELEDARVRVACDGKEQLVRNERKRHVVADSIASLECTRHAADAERTWQHERLVGWLLFQLRALDVLDTCCRLHRRRAVSARALAMRTPREQAAVSHARALRARPAVDGRVRRCAATRTRRFYC